MADNMGDAALGEVQNCLLICSELATSPPMAQFNRLLGHFEHNMATQIVGGGQNWPLAFRNCRRKRNMFLG